MQTQTKWTSEAGPRQTKAVNESIAKLNWRGKTRIELGDYGTRELVNVCGEPSEQSQAALAEIGETYGYTITRSNYSAIIAALTAATESLELPVDDCRSTEKEIQERQERVEKARLERESQEQAAQAVGATILAKKPEWATALIVAELDENQSDSMTDYFAHKTTRRVAIGWRNGKREDFRQFRAAAATFEETKHLGPGLGVFKVRSVWADTCPNYTHCKGDYRPGYELDGETFQTREAAEQAIANSGEDMRLSYQAGSELLTGLVEYRIWEEEVEHRENYSMGAGYYLKAGSDNWDGWRVRSMSLGEIGHTVLEDRLPNPSEPKSAVKSAGHEVQKHYHTKRQCDIWAVVLAERVERTEFERLRDECKSAGGWFSPKWGAFPGGFCFATEASAAEWAAKMFDSGSGAEQSPSEPPKAPNTADNLRSLADGMQTKIDERTRPMTQNYTQKRGREYNVRMHEGANLQRCQKALRALAELHESGTCPDVLKGLRTKAQILPLVSTAGDTQGYYDYRDSGRYKDTSEQGKALQALIDETQAERQSRELTYKLQELQRSNIEGFFPTPRSVALQMIELAEILPGMVVLEPSAGAGHLADVIREECGQLVSINCCERMHSLREILKLKGHSLLEETDALEIRPQDANYDRILMNPPFENGQDAEHTRKAYECLAENGRLVSVISQGLLCRSDRKATEFREWLDEVGGEVIELPEDSFNTSEAFRRTGVSTALVVISK